MSSGLEPQYGPGLNVYLHCKTPSLLGGLRIQVGSDVYDGSVQRTAGKFARGILT